MTVQTKKQYEELNTKTAVSYLINLGLIKTDEETTVAEIGDGNLNYVFHIISQTTGRSFIIKQALPYAKVVGESWPLTLDRARIEASALKEAAKVVPELVPKVFHLDPDLALTVMEDLSHLTILRAGLIAGNQYPLVAEHIGKYLAHTLFTTSTFGINPQAAKKLAVTYSNPELCKITEDLVFTDPYFNCETNNFEEHLTPRVHELWQDKELKKEVAKLKHLFLTKSETLIHGDLHTGSIFVSETETKVIDPEFSFYGPFGFDIGAFLANLIMNLIAQEGHQQDSEQKEDLQNYLLDTIEKTWDIFTSEFKKLWLAKSIEPFSELEGYVEEVLTDIWQDALGFTGCKMIRRMIGLAHVLDVDSIESAEIRLRVQTSIINLGRKLILERKQIGGVLELVSTVEGAYS
ncbi:methylthioribose kinase [Alkalihalobacillus alcalophilus ATCC 27647 = CGMCC 1.3604]|uniref:Methylthioribose kinase n=1 Tax=Alkalihalobacillus alcalophilus ATCC 27647 = CGMCC 1.3604 TaxID=1218173 RepID=A0A094WMC3_ALKAL|nr:S-methyl-5-thioribose kinase [Alkalihalobacillus alcalophilus]KGA97113.1 methylthioribose kinase [Alkalihalobacillus alcalophilus ATCC 27647 = CGMCC 1.3604]MED1563084.1 S-methyl-5-thioribose kinase [Alkalihalobacillus alcalophilus]THG89837.1 methylthioribose kinase [Alkalihalobacillus alcalophilus ATCC 27647 = CGMCC 1.3604]